MAVEVVIAMVEAAAAEAVAKDVTAEAAAAVVALALALALVEVMMDVHLHVMHLFKAKMTIEKHILFVSLKIPNMCQGFQSCTVPSSA